MESSLQLFYLTMDVTVRKTGIPIKRTMVSLNQLELTKDMNYVQYLKRHSKDLS